MKRQEKRRLRRSFLNVHKLYSFLTFLTQLLNMNSSHNSGLQSQFETWQLGHGESVPLPIWSLFFFWEMWDLSGSWCFVVLAGNTRWWFCAGLPSCLQQHCDWSWFLRYNTEWLKLHQIYVRYHLWWAVCGLKWLTSLCQPKKKSISWMFRWVKLYFQHWIWDFHNSQTISQTVAL